MTLNAEIKLF